MQSSRSPPGTIRTSAARLNEQRRSDIHKMYNEKYAAGQFRIPPVFMNLQENPAGWPRRFRAEFKVREHSSGGLLLDSNRLTRMRTRRSGRLRRGGTSMKAISRLAIFAALPGVGGTVGCAGRARRVDHRHDRRDDRHDRRDDRHDDRHDRRDDRRDNRHDHHHHRYHG